METLQTLCSELIERWDSAPTPSDFMDFDGYGVIEKIRAAIAADRARSHPAAAAEADGKAVPEP